MGVPAFLPGADRFLSEAQRKQQSQKFLTRDEKLIERANAVSIFDVLEDYFDIRVPREGNSFKSRCPFGSEHDDGGLDKGWRTYPATNSSMCFPMHGYMTPVRLIQLQSGQRQAKAAESILKNYDLLKPRHWTQRYEELLLEQETRVSEPVGNPQHAVEALHMALRGEPSYSLRQFDPDVMQVMEVVLERLNTVCTQGDPEQVRVWYQQAKSILLKIVRKG